MRCLLKKVSKLRWACYLEVLLLLRATFIFYAIFNALVTIFTILHLVSGQPSDNHITLFDSYAMTKLHLVSSQPHDNHITSSDPYYVWIFLHLLRLASCAYFHLHPEDMFR